MVFFRAKIADNFKTQEGIARAIESVQTPGNKAAMEIDLNLLMELKQIGLKLESKTLKERFDAEHKVLYIQAHNRFFNSFNEKFKQMFEAGLFDHYICEAKEIYLRKTREKILEPFKVLTLEELEAGFVVCLLPLLLAMAIFCCEWIVVSKNFAVAYFMLQAYFSQQNGKV